MESTFLVQGRDFYSNNVIQAIPTDVKVQIVDSDDKIVSLGTMIESG